MRTALIALALTMLMACKEDVAQDTTPVPLTEDSIGHFCQMSLLEHDGPKGQIHLEGLPGTPLYFSQVRDLVAYLRMPEQSHVILAAWVNDMGAPGASWDARAKNSWIAAEDAMFVVGGRAVGGMGAPEVVPFLDPDKAAAFANANGGQVLRLAEIPDSAVLTPVDLVPANPDSETADTDFTERLRGLSRTLGE
ncbi:MAG: nitrous oxide reductase accessory protein NosL [Gemmobacter sp.]|nr:nitrous oxide reductase accessory protein NosL [Gemmobacter sp.]